MSRYPYAPDVLCPPTQRAPAPQPDLYEIVMMSVPGERFDVPGDASSDDIRLEVKRRYGYEYIGVPHSWFGIPKYSST